MPRIHIPRWTGWLLAGAAALLGWLAVVWPGFAASASDAAHRHPARSAALATHATRARATRGTRDHKTRAHHPRGHHPRAHKTSAARTGNWISTWAAAPQGPVAGNLSRTGFRDQTLRQLVYPSIGGSQVRVELSNAFGSTPLVIGAAAVGAPRSGTAYAAPRSGPTAALATNRPLTFGGQTSLLIPPGAEALSDPVRLTVRPLQALAISLYLPSATGPATEHQLALQTSFAGHGNLTAQLDSTGFSTRTGSWYFLSGIDVLAPRRDVGAVVALGDSITDGVGSTPNADDRWPDDLARRLDTRRGRSLAVIDEGIGGNRLLNNASCCGSNAVARFQRDVAGRAGVREVILLEGVNDIGFSRQSGPLTAPHTDVSAAQIIAGEQLIIAQAHAAGLKIFGATLTPFSGARYWSPAGEAKREAVNQWIRTGGAFDGVIDFAKALADPADPARLDPAYDSGDHLHPNRAGYLRMARAIDLGALLRGA